MRHRLHRVFGKEDNKSSSPQKLRTPSTFTSLLGKNPHFTKVGKRTKLHSKSTYFYRWSSYVVPSVCGLALLLGGLVMINPDISMGINANSAYANEGANDNSGIELYTADSAISLTIANDGSFVGNANVDEVSYITNTFTINVTNHASYTVKMNAMNGSGTELRGRDNAFATIKGVGNKVAPANFASNTWGYSWSEDTTVSPDTLTYSSMPAYGSDESMFTKELTGTEKGQDFSYLLAFAAKIGDDSPADHYVGNFLLSVVGTAFTPETYYLNFNANGGSNPPSAQSCAQTQVGGDCKLTITNDEPARENYTFLGWADSKNATQIQYGAGSEITLSGTTTLYAVWEANTIPFNGITTMQEMTSTVCSGADIGTESILRDTRDDKLYYVTKLKGDTAGTKEKGECWMTQNLAYGKTTDTSIGTPCELSRSDDNPASNGAKCTDGTSWTNSNTDKYFAIGKHDDGSHTSQGNFYNWQAAIQGTTGGTGIQGVCPSGWQLPISNASTTTDRSFNKLVTAYGAANDAAGSAIMRGAPMYFQYSGLVSSGSLDGSGSYGRYWSSTVGSSNIAYGLYLNSSGAYPSNNVNVGNRNAGNSVRCVAQ